MTFNHRIMAAALLATALSACTATDPNLGNAVRQSMAAQVIDPDPDYTDKEQTTAATQSAAAVARYRNGTVKKPDTIRTTDTQTGSPQ